MALHRGVGARSAFRWITWMAIALLLAVTAVPLAPTEPVDAYGPAVATGAKRTAAGPVVALGVAASDMHTCAVRTDNTLTCWEKFIGTRSTPPITGAYTQVAVGLFHSCALKTDQSITCWGASQFGALEPPSGAFKQISVGLGNSCALRTNDQVVCWGLNANGQSSPPTGEFLQVSAGVFYSCAIRKSNGNSVCWGWNDLGQLGSPPPIPIPNNQMIERTGPFKQISGYTAHTCALRTDNGITCWGAGTVNTNSEPHYGQSIVPSGSYKQVSNGRFHTCGIKLDDTMTCWGLNQSGVGQTNQGQTNVPPGYKWRMVSAGLYHTCGITFEDFIMCWGENGEGQAPDVLVDVSGLPNGAIGVPYNVNLVATGGKAPYIFSLAAGSSLPAGLSLSASGQISGVPTAAGTFPVSIIVIDNNVMGVRKNYSLTIGLIIVPNSTVIPTVLPDGTIGIPYSQQISAIGGTPPYSFAISAGSLPAGLTFTPAGLLSGTPTTAGTSLFSVTGTDARGLTASIQYSLTIAKLTITPATLSSANLGVAYSQQLGVVSQVPGPYTFSVTGGTLPTGLTLSTAGLLSGTPSALGRFTFTVQARATTGDTGSRTYSLDVTLLGRTLWYFAEGYTGPGFFEYLTIQNPNSTNADVKITYFLTGGLPIVKTFAVPANSRDTVVVHEEQRGVGRNNGNGWPVSAKVETTNSVGIVVERPMYFTYGGRLGNVTGGHNVMGVNDLRTSWLFAEGYTGDGFDEYLTIMNPSGDAANVTITYFLASGAPIVKNFTVTGNSRDTVVVHDANRGVGPGQAVSAKVESTIGIVVERPMYFRYTGSMGQVTGGHNVMGTSGPQPAWYFPDGATVNGFDTYLTLMNTFATASQVRLTYYVVGEATPRTKEISVAPNSRQTVLVHEASEGVGRGLAVGIKVETINGVSIVAERPMYFRYNAAINGGHNVMGATAPGSSWLFAEGYTGDGFDEYLVLLNPSAVSADVRITYQLTGAGPQTRTLTVAGNSRATVNVKDPGQVGANQAVSAKVETTNGINIVVERPMYFRFNGNLDGGHTVMGWVP